MIRLILELTDEQELFLDFAVSEMATLAWEHSVRAELEPCERHPDGSCAASAAEDVVAAEAILAQLPGGALARWRASLSEHGVDDDGEEVDE
jgi:hypothetical protein